MSLTLFQTITRKQQQQRIVLIIIVSVCSVNANIFAEIVYSVELLL